MQLLGTPRLYLGKGAMETLGSAAAGWQGIASLQQIPLNGIHPQPACFCAVLQKALTVAFNRNISRALQSQPLLMQSGVRSIVVVIFLKWPQNRESFCEGAIKHFDYSYVELAGLLGRVIKCPP